MKTEAKVTHTPGPWKWYFAGTAGNYCLFSADGPVQSSCSPLHKGESFPPDMVLIAASPDMLEALEDALALINEHADELAGFEHPDRINAVVDASRAAIAKARGGAA